MKDLELKNKVLNEIMGLMDDKEGEMLKSHPKLVKAKIDVIKPIAVEADEEGESKDLKDKELALGDLGESKDEGEEIDPDMLEMLMEKLGHLKD